MLTLSSILSRATNDEEEDSNKPNAEAVQKVLDDMDEEDEKAEAAREKEEEEEETKKEEESDYCVEEEEEPENDGLFSDSETQQKKPQTKTPPVTPVHPIVRTSRRCSKGNGLMTSDRELMFSSLEKVVASALAKDEASHSGGDKKNRLLERDYAEIRVEILKQYRNIPDTDVNKKQNFITKTTPEIIEELLAAKRVKKTQPKVTKPKKNNNTKKRKAPSRPPSPASVTNKSPKPDIESLVVEHIKASRMQLDFD